MLGIYLKNKNNMFSQNLLIIIYSISAILLIAVFIIEKRITVLEMLIAFLVFAVPFVNVIILLYTLIEVMNRRGIISLKSILDWIVKFLNYRIK